MCSEAPHPGNVRFPSGAAVDYCATVAPGAHELSPMRCEECGVQAAGHARGWRGYRIDDPEDGDLPEMGFFCPDCAYREFGPLLDQSDRSDHSDSGAQ
jgi:hypothetical protein